jgi:hypothetical protein
MPMVQAIPSDSSTEGTILSPKNGAGPIYINDIVMRAVPQSDTIVGYFNLSLICNMLVTYILISA